MAKNETPIGMDWDGVGAIILLPTGGTVLRPDGTVLTTVDSFFVHLVAANSGDGIAANSGEEIRSHIYARPNRRSLFERTPQGSSDAGSGSDLSHPRSEVVPPTPNQQQTLVEPAGLKEKAHVETTREDVRDVWDHYCSLFGNRYKLDQKRTRIIQQALKVRPLDQVKKAISGLHVSPHHNGKNDRKTKYLDIRYALKGIGNESDDERIDKMALLAPAVDSTPQTAGITAPGLLARFREAWEAAGEMARNGLRAEIPRIVARCEADGFDVTLTKDGVPYSLKAKA